MSSNDNRRAGLGSEFSVIVGRDTNGRRFGNETEFSEPENALVAANDGQVAAMGLGLATVASGLTFRWADGHPVIAPTTASRGLQLRVKRFIDIIVAGLALLGLLPLFALVAIAIRLTDGGPVFFRQQRTGKNGDLFWILKFRTMYVDKGDHSGVSQTVAGDPRIMPIGAALRRTSVDELPQLMNVILGDMSLVGPRPHVPTQLAATRPYRDLVPYYDLRHVMLPGLTGWAQANGFRGPTDDPVKARARIDHDLAYIQNFSLWLDLKILFRTIKREFLTGSGL